MSLDTFTQAIQSGYTASDNSITLGTAMFNKQAVPGLKVTMPLNTVNRHGLIAGATGTGKTKTIQHLAEELSSKGVSVLLMDIKGDLSGIAKPGTENQKILDRHKLIGTEWSPRQYPVELLTISDEKGARLRATITEFGPILLSKILELNDNQQGVVTIVFKYCDDNNYALLDIRDFRQALQYLSTDGKDEVKAYGQMSPATVGVILRKLLEIEQQDADQFFGEESFDVNDLLRKDEQGRGFINILRLTDMQDKPKLFSTFMLCLMAEVFEKFPEMGDKAAPKLVIFIDEAHLIFRDATKALMQQLETVVKLIRSKGVGLYFCTQVPGDIPEAILSQLGAKFQHALRAFTAKDRKEIKLVAENYPVSEFYDTDSLLTELGIGEALVAVLNEKGIPTPIAHTLLCAPCSRMDVISPEEQDEIVTKSSIASKYNRVIDRESAYELLSRKVASSGSETSRPAARASSKKTSEPASPLEETIIAASKNPLVKTVAREMTRGLFGLLTKAFK